jgi:hypothetical protein
MPRNEREYAKRKLKQVIGNLDIGGQYLYELAELYRPVHPEIAEQLDLMMQYMAEGITVIDQIEKSI